MFISDQLCSSHRLCPPFLFFLPPPQLANRSNLQRSPRGFFLSVLSGPRVGQSTRIIALRARARSDTCRGHRPPSCTLGQRLTTLSFHRFYKRNPPIIPHVICPTLTAMESCTWNNTNRWCSSNLGARGYKTATPLTQLIAPFSSVAARTRLPLSLSLSILRPFVRYYWTNNKNLHDGGKFSSIPTLTFSSLHPVRKQGLDAGWSVESVELLSYRGRRNDWRVFHPRPACV